MLLYHGSSKSDLKTLLPFVADHGKPYVYFSTDEVSAAFYAVNRIDRPFYWFPYGYDANGKPVYTEVFPNAFAESYSNKYGYLYVCEQDEKKLLRFPSNPNMRLAVDPVPVHHAERIENLYTWFLQHEHDGRLAIQRYSELSPAVLSLWHGIVLEELQSACAIHSLENPYARFVQEKIPSVWERFLIESE